MEYSFLQELRKLLILQSISLGHYLLGELGPSTLFVRTCLEQALGLAHGALEVESAHVLPVLLQQGDEEVDAHLGVDVQLLVRHADVADGNTQAQHLLQLELDRRLDVVDLQGPQYCSEVRRDLQTRCWYYLGGSHTGPGSWRPQSEPYASCAHNYTTFSTQMAKLGGATDSASADVPAAVLSRSGGGR